MNKKYEMLKDDAVTSFGRTLYRVKATKDFGDVKKGELGGYIEKEENLSENGDAWVSGDAEVYGNARVINASDYIVFKNNWSSGRYFTWTKSVLVPFYRGAVVFASMLAVITAAPNSSRPLLSRSGCIFFSL